jgi:hypothetical protein
MPIDRPAISENNGKVCYFAVQRCHTYATHLCDRREIKFKMALAAFNDTDKFETEVSGHTTATDQRRLVGIEPGIKQSQVNNCTNVISNTLHRYMHEYLRPGMAVAKPLNRDRCAAQGSLRFMGEGGGGRGINVKPSSQAGKGNKSGDFVPLCASLRVLRG